VSLASLEERLENAGDKKKQKIVKKNQNNPRIQQQREDQMKKSNASKNKTSVTGE